MPPYSKTLNDPVKPLTIGIAREHFAEGLDAEVEQAVRAALKVYEAQGAQIKDVSLPMSKYAVATYYLDRGVRANGHPGTDGHAHARSCERPSERR